MDYHYYKQIKTPTQLGMSGDGGMGSLSSNIAAIEDYVNLLVAGDSQASTTGRVLGNKYFVDTNATCKNEKGEDVSRSIYIDNVPSGKSSFLTEPMNVIFGGSQGLVPGIFEDLMVLNPESIVSAFEQTSTPQCSSVNAKVIDQNGTLTYQTNYVSNEDIKGISACNFKDGVNPITGEKCSEGFVGNMMEMRDMSNFGQGNMFELDEMKEWISQKRDWKQNMIIGGSSLIMLYLIWKMYSQR